jgi:hypothetical protein
MILWVDRTVDLVRRSLRVESRFFCGGDRGQTKEEAKKPCMHRVGLCAWVWLGVPWGCPLGSSQFE